MIYFFYNIIFIPVAKTLLAILTKFNVKVKDRELAIPHLNIKISKIPKLKKRIWIHSSSMGEFEQAKPLIELLNKSQGFDIVCTFFSPSGYNNQRNYELATIVTYLPFDTKRNAIDFIELIKPDLAIFIRYDLWLNYLSELKKRNINAFLINATIPSNSFKSFPIVKQYYGYCFSCFHSVFTVGEEQSSYYNSLNLANFIITSSDTRLDRIAQQVEIANDNPIIPKELFADEFVIVAGSTWLADEEALSTAVNLLRNNNLNIRVIYVPHEPNQIRLNEILELIPNSILLSELINYIGKYSVDEVKLDIKNKDIIVDSIGKLLRLYSSADVAMIGCGWGDGVHSVSEPAGYGIPLICGPNIKRMPDAIKLFQLKGLSIANSYDDIYRWISNLINNKEHRIEIGKINSNYIFNSKGASELIANYISKFLQP